MQISQYRIDPDPSFEISFLDTQLAQQFKNFITQEMKGVSWSDTGTKTVKDKSVHTFSASGMNAPKFFRQFINDRLEEKQINSQQAEAFKLSLDLAETEFRTHARERKLNENEMIEQLKQCLDTAIPVVTPGSLRLRDLQDEETPGFVHVVFNRCPKGIKEIKLMAAGPYFSDQRLPDDYLYSFMRVESNEGNIGYFRIKDEKQLNLLRNLGAEHAIATELYPVANLYKAEDWKRAGIEGIYFEDIHQDYKVLHQKFVQEVDTFLRMHPEIKKVRIIELGCGHGKALFEVAARAGKIVGADNVICLGGDYSDVNIKKAYALWKEKKESKEDKAPFPYRFVILDSTSKECEDLLTKKEEGFTDLVICSGHLTRCVLDNVFQVQKVFNILHRANCPYVFSSGEREELYTRDTLEQMGFNGLIESTSSASFQAINLLERPTVYPPIEKFMESKDQRYLNLSMCPDPIQIVEQFKNNSALKNVECLDLSYCELSRYDIATLSEFFNQFENLKKIIFVSPDIRELTYINKNKDALIPHHMQELDVTQIHTLHVKDERLATLSYDFYSMIDKDWLLRTLQQEDPTITEVPEFYLRQDYFPPSIFGANLKGGLEEIASHQDREAKYPKRKDEHKKHLLFTPVHPSEHPLAEAPKPKKGK